MARDYTSTVKALLAKARSTESAEEAAILTAKVAELMMRHGIDEAHLREDKGQAPDEVTLLDIELPAEWEKALQTAIHHLAKSIGAQTIVGVTADAITLVGTSSMLANLETLITCLEMQLVSASNREGDKQEAKIRDAHPSWTDNQVGNEVDRWVSDYVVGWGRGVAEKIEARRQGISDETPGNALALRTEADRVKAAYNEMFPHRSSVRGRQRDYAAMSAGHRDGRNADIGGNRVANTRAALT